MLLGVNLDVLQWMMLSVHSPSWHIQARWSLLECALQMHIQIWWWCVFCIILLKHGENLSAGMYYTHIYDNLIVGSQPQSKYDIERLFKDEGVRAILNLQQDKDIEYWGIDINSILHKCQELGIWHMRIPVCFSQQKGTSTFQTQIVWL